MEIPIETQQDLRTTAALSSTSLESDSSPGSFMLLEWWWNGDSMWI